MEERNKNYCFTLIDYYVKLLFFFLVYEIVIYQICILYEIKNYFYYHYYYYCFPHSSGIFPSLYIELKSSKMLSWILLPPSLINSMDIPSTPWCLTIFHLCQCPIKLFYHNLFKILLHLFLFQILFLITFLHIQKLLEILHPSFVNLLWLCDDISLLILDVALLCSASSLLFY